MPEPEPIRLPSATSADTDSAATEPVPRLPAAEMLRVAEIAQSRLARYAREDARRCRVAHLFADRHYQGVRYRLGRFSATWLFRGGELQFFRDLQPIGTVDLDDRQRRAA